MTAPTIGQLGVQVQAQFRGFVISLERQLQAISRAQTLKIRAKLQEQSLAKINAQLKSFSGINTLQKSFESASEHVTGFFDNLAPIARRLSLIGAAAGPLGTALVSLGPAFAAVGTAATGALAALPGLAAGAGAAFFVFQAAMGKKGKEVKKELSGFVTQFHQLKNEVADNFWAGATKGVSTFLNSAIKPLRAGFGQLSTEMGKFTGGLGTALSKALTPDVYKKFFDGLSTAFDHLTTTFATPFSDIIAKLVTFSSGLFTQIADGLGSVTVKLDTFLTKNPDFLTKAWGTFVAILKGVFSTIGSVVSIFGSLAKAATDAGIGATNLSSPLKIVSDALSSLKGQSTLVSIFTSLKGGADGLSVAFKPLGNALANLLPIIAQFIDTAGKTLGPVFKTLFDSINRPEVLKNISGLLQAFPKIFKDIQPSIGLVVDKISGLASVAAVTVDQIGKTLNSVLQAILPAVTPLFEPLKKVVATVGDTIRMVFGKIGPVLKSLTPAFASLIGAVQDFMKALQSPAAKFIIDLLLGFIKTAVSGFLNLAKGVMKVVSGLLMILSGNWKGFSKIFSGLGDLIKGAFQLFITFFSPAKILGILGRAFGGLATKIIPGILGGLVRLLVKLGPIGVRMARGLLNGFLNLITHTIPDIGKNIIAGLITGVSAAIGGLISWLTDHIIKPILSFFGIHSPSKLFADIGGNLIKGLINGIKAIIGFLVDVFKVPIQLIVKFFELEFKGIVIIVSAVWKVLSAAFNIFINVIKVGLSIIGTIFSAIWNGIKIVVGLVFDGLKLYFQVWMAIITTGINIISTIFSAVWDAIKVAGAAVWDFLKAAFTVWYNIISTAIGVIGTIIGAVWDGIKTAGEFIWNALVTAFQVWYGIISTAIGVIGTIIGAIWDGIKTAGAAIWDFLVTAFQVWYGIISTAIGVIGTIIGAVWDGIKAAGEFVWNALVTAFQVWYNIIATAIHVIAAVISAVWDGIKAAGAAVWDFIVGAFNNFKGGIQAGIQWLSGIVTGVWNTIKSVGSSIWDGIKGAFDGFVGGIQRGVEGIKGFFSGVGDAIKAPFRAAFNFIADIWNNTVGRLHFTIPSWVPGIGGDSFGVPTIPHWANGVRNAMGGLAIVGERGPELVNIPRGSDVYTNGDTQRMLASAIAASGVGGGDTFVVSIKLDVNDLERMKTVADFVDMLKNARVDARRTAGSGTVAV